MPTDRDISVPRGQLVIEVNRLDDHVSVLDDTIIVVRHPVAADGAIVEITKM